MKQILAAVDLSPVTAAVTSFARSLAGGFGARLHLVHIVDPDPDFVGYEVGPQSVRDQVAHKYHQQHRAIQEIAETLRSEGVDTTALLIQGPTVEKILDVCERIGADLIVAGSHGHSALHRLILGSVSEGLIRANRYAVLIVPGLENE